MKIIKKITNKAKNLAGAEPVTVAFLGDSVTQGCFDNYATSENTIQTYFDAENAYHTKFRKILNKLYPNVPLNIINAGISGGKSWEGVERLERDVLRFSPDLCVVCFGLNDASSIAEDALIKYENSLKAIFKALQDANIEVIYMTPNMMSTHVSCHIENDLIKRTAEYVAKVQNSGKLETFLSAGKKIAESMGVTVCDCYSKWKRLYDNGVDITELLANRLNHPTEDMNWLFAINLVETILN